MIRRLAVSLALMTLAAHLVAADTLVLSPVAVQQEPTPSGGRWVLFGDLSIDQTRAVTFTASVSTGQVGVFRYRRRTVETLLLTGDPAPPAAGNRFSIFLEAASNTRGDLAFTAYTFFPDRQGLYLMRDGVVTTVALEGEVAPTPDGEWYASFDQVYLTETGEVYFGAGLLDPAGSRTRAILKADTTGVHPVIARGDRYGLRQVEEPLQFAINAAGDVTTVARITDADLFAEPQTVTEVILLADGRLRTLASVNLVLNAGNDQVRNFAITYNQVDMTETGESVFYAGSDHFLHGGYYANRAGRLFANERLLAQGDLSPLEPGDRIDTPLGFGITSSGMLVFHATTLAARGGALFARKDGEMTPIAVAGEPRPDGLAPWHGFLQIAVDESGAFAFSDFQGLAQVAVYAGRFIPPPSQILASLRAIIEESSLPRGAMSGLSARLEPIEAALRRDRTETALRLARSFLQEITARTDHGLAPDLVLALETGLEDLILALGG